MNVHMLGVAVHHMNQPDNSYYSNGDSKLDMKITAHAGTLIGLNGINRSVEVEDLSISPNIMYQQQGEFHQLNAGMYLICIQWYSEDGSGIILKTLMPLYSCWIYGSEI
jgi:hypothetical protein